MPKEIRASRGASSIRQSRASPYSCKSKNTEQQKLEQSVISHGNEKEWEEILCPICMDHPHNAVLLMCSSHEKGCRPYMCDSSRRHSNCLDQFRKSSPVVNDNNEERLLELGDRQKTKSTLQCPLCRGKVRGFVVSKPSREFMNSKPRNCSLETCKFSGTYSELRMHARLEHPKVHPSNTDPTRQNEWARLEQEMDFQDFISATQAGYNGEHEWNYGSLLDMEVNFEEILNTVETLDSDYGFEWNDDDADMGMELEMPVELEMAFDFLDVPVAPTVWIETNDFNRRSIQTGPRTHGSQSTRESHQSYSSRETWQNQRGSMPHYSGGRDDGATSRPPPSPDSWFSHRTLPRRERR
ncbi:uncharacterized protein LOC124931155 [Impatiens glandulifera]|uniref:uncharacterized protein LOC124931155 n=1 Tax=Impatiens glandulifera TaxID=253017 RepID=UPI001FB0EBC8|nr:uncharacterized protein LOC124931155 [Impatiens glandulifera]XP_047327508.1 uncharacterized protein LOC124931155 [Impatiens glandulifera]